MDSRFSILWNLCNLWFISFSISTFVAYPFELVDRLTVVLHSVIKHDSSPLVFCPGLELRAMAAKVIQRHPIAAGAGDSGQMDPDEGADTDDRPENRTELFELRVFGFNDFSVTVEAHDLRSPVERAKH